ncbi:FtsX-like permease family protein [Verticiella sediminum]|uniref:FtsX-like permease family protein n=1 Tax=Verticiella sediminum TaxID=1247510 RepID=A0A556B311_9BURK|nr:FtsX-like permease family protein [Verticiella sediminum]TSH99235.1 FtsX-like permease family protein [Verticiella sediminum]
MRVLRVSLGALLAHWRRHPVQAIAVFVGIWLATTLWAGVQALNSQARADYARASAVLAPATQAAWVPRTGEHLDQALYVALRRAGWPVSPVLEGRVRLVEAEQFSLRVVGIEPLSLPDDTEVAGRTGARFDLGAFIGPPGEAWISPDTLARLGLAEGARPALADGTRLPPFKAEPGLAPGVILTDVGYAQALLNAPGQLSRLIVTGPHAEAPPPAFADRLMLSADDTAGDLQRLTDSFHLNLTALGLLAFVVGLFIVNAAIGLAFEQRRGVLRTLRACGVSLRAAVAALALELGLFALIGGVAGLVTGYALAAQLLPDVSASLRGLYGADVAGELRLSPVWWASGLGITLLGALIAGANSLWRAARMPVLAVAQAQAWRLAQTRGLRRDTAVGLVLLLVCAAAWRWGDSLATAFVAVGALLLAAALLLSPLLDAALAGLARLARGPLAEWFAADARQQLPAVALALMALLLALGASVGVGAMTEGFRKTFDGWLEQRLSADLYVTPRDTEQGLAIARAAAAEPDVAAVLTQWRAELRLQAWPVQAYGVPDHPSYRQHWPLLAAQPEGWAALGRGEGIMLSEQLARRLGLGLGDTLALPLPGTAPLPVVGLYADYGNPQGQLLVNADWLRRHEPQARISGISLRLQPGTDAGKRLEARLQPWAEQGARVVDQAALKRWSTDIFERTFHATAALNSLTLAVAGIALFISLLTLADARLGQLAPLWALGVPRRRLAWLSLAQTLMLAGLTVLLAVPLGLVLAWCLVAVVNVQAFGWRLPLYVFPGQLLALALLGLLTALAASAGPLWQLARRKPADLLRRFADER